VVESNSYIHKTNERHRNRYQVQYSASSFIYAITVAFASSIFTLPDWPPKLSQSGTSGATRCIYYSWRHDYASSECSQAALSAYVMIRVSRSGGWPGWPGWPKWPKVLEAGKAFSQTLSAACSLKWTLYLKEVSGNMIFFPAKIVF
jgi:hypothetical protein